MIKYGCQTYTWQMVGDAYLERLDHIIAVAGSAGFHGVESEMRFLGKLRDPQMMADHLGAAGIRLASLCLVEDWNGSKETPDEKEDANWTIDYLAKHYPGTVLNVCPMPGPDRRHLVERQNNQLSCMNAIAQRAADRGVLAGYHPNSPDGSVCRTASDYERMLNGIDARYLGWIPDAGHIAKGGMDVLHLIKEYRNLVVHVHFKDMGPGGDWEAMGQGVIDFRAISLHLRDTGYQGWLVVEDESPAAAADPDAAVRLDGAYMRELLAEAGS